MIIRTVQFMTNDGQTFSTESEALAHEVVLINYGRSLVELKEFLTKAQVMLDTKPELTELNNYLENNNNALRHIFDGIDDYNTKESKIDSYHVSY